MSDSSKWYRILQVLKVNILAVLVTETEGRVMLLEIIYCKNDTVGSLTYFVTNIYVDGA